MKKLLMLLMCGGLLVGCSSQYSVKVTDGDKEMISGGEVSITKQDIFEYLLDKNGANEIVNEVLTTIADKEVNDQEALDKLVKQREEDYAKYAGGDLEKYAKNLGYDSKDDYIKAVLVPDAKQELLRNKYINENLETLIKNYQICSFKKIVVDKESTALSYIEKATDEEAFNKLMKENSDKSEDSGIVTKNSSLDDNLKKQLETLSAVSKDGVYKEAIKLSDDTYAVLYLYNTDHKNTDDLTNTLSNDSDVKDEINASYLKKYQFTVNDDKIKKAIEKISSNYVE